LHVYDIAGVACILARWTRKAGHESQVINMYDPFGFCDFYCEERIADEKAFVDRVLQAGKDYDILHVHTVYRILPRLAELRKPVIMHYHGSELAQSQGDPFREWCEQFANKILVANEYLMKYHDRAQWLPNPVDTKHFKPTQGDKKNASLMFDIPYIDYEKTLSELPHDIRGNVVVANRLKRPVRYGDMPLLLNEYSNYIDIKYHRYQGLLPALSKTGLEALSCGLSVLNWKKEWVKGLPGHHKPESVVSSLLDVYENLLV